MKIWCKCRCNSQRPGIYHFPFTSTTISASISSVCHCKQSKLRLGWSEPAIRKPNESYFQIRLCIVDIYILEDQKDIAKTFDSVLNFVMRWQLSNCKSLNWCFDVLLCGLIWSGLQIRIVNTARPKGWSSYPRPWKLWYQAFLFAAE